MYPNVLYYIYSLHTHFVLIHSITKTNGKDRHKYINRINETYI